MANDGKSAPLSDDGIQTAQGKANRGWVNPRIAIIVSIAIILAHLIIIYYPNVGPVLRVALDDSLFAFADALATAALFYAASVSEKSSQFRKAWLVLAAAQLSFTIGDIIWAYLDVVQGEPPLPSPSDIPYLLYYPLFLAGIFMIPAEPMSQKKRIAALIDTSIVILSGIIIFWFLLIEPTIASATNDDLLTRMIAIAYPVMDLMLFFGLTEMILMRIGSRWRTSLILLAGSAAAALIADTVFFSEFLQDSYISGSLLDVAWLIQYALVGLAGVSYATYPIQEKRRESTDYIRYTWPYYFPYIWVAGSFSLLIWSHDNIHTVPFYTISITVGAIIGLVIIRQVFTINENSELFDKVLLEVSERKQAEEKVHRLNEELEMRVAERTSQLEATNRDLEKEITERSKMEEALRESENLFRTLVSNMLDGMVILNLEGRVVFANSAAAKLAGFSQPEEGLGINIIDLIPPEYRESALRDLELVKQGNDAFLSEYKIRSVDGKDVWIEGLSKLITFRGNPADLITVRDITYRKEVEKELRRARDKLEENVALRTAELETKNAEMERFIYTVSHDLRTPLITINGFAGFLEKDLKDGNLSKVMADLKSITESVATMDLLLSKTLELSRIGRVASPPEVVAFGDIVEEALRTTSEMIRSRGVEINVASNFPSVNVDQIRIVEVLVNLIENCIKYFGDSSNPKIEIGCRTDAGEPVFFVKDNGIGIDPSQHEKVFGLFYKIDKKSPGTGAGMAIVRRIIEFHGGRVWIESALGKGTVVCFTLPMASPSPDEELGKTINGDGQRDER